MRRRDEQDDDSQLRILSQGYLSSRTTSQFLVVRAAPAATELTVSESPQGEIQVINRLGTSLERLWITDSRGNLFAADDVAEGLKVQLQPAKPASEEKRIAAVLLAGRNQLSQDFDKNMRNRFVGSLGRQYWMPGIGPPSCATSCLEINLQDARNFLPPRPKAYLAVTRQVPSVVPVGIDAGEEAGFHVIRGHW